MKKEIHDKLITDLTALTFNGTTPIFTTVKKALYAFQDELDCLLIPGDPDNQVSGQSTDIRSYAFSLLVREFLENANNQTELDLKIDRLSNIEDKVLDYLQKLPNPINTSLSGINVMQILVSPCRYDYASNERGVEINLVVNFAVQVVITPQLL